MLACYQNVQIALDLSKFRNSPWTSSISMQNTTAEELQLTDRLSLKTFYKTWRLLQFFVLTNIALLRKNAADPVLVYNSLARVITIEKLVEFLQILACGGHFVHAENGPKPTRFTVEAGDTTAV
jgi:hypothetical protein